MAKLSIKAGSKKESVNVFIRDSSSTTGAGLTGLVFNSAGLTAYYCRPRTSATAITLATLASATAAWSSGGFKEIDATNMPGWYRLDLPDAALAAGARFADVHLKGATNMAPLPLEIDLGAQVTAVVQNVTIRSGTAQSGSGATTIKLDTGASATSNIYNGCIVALTGGVGVGQTAVIVSYNGGTKVATVNKTWATTPDATTTFDLYAASGSIFADSGTATAGAAGSLTLAATASTSDDVYNGSMITILAGTGSGQTREISDYDGTTKVATVSSNWSVTPDSTSVYAVIPAATNAADSGGGTPAFNPPLNWSSQVITAAGGVMLADGVAHGGTLGSSTATLAMQKVNVTTASGTAFRLSGPKSFVAENDSTGGYLEMAGVNGLSIYGGEASEAIVIEGPYTTPNSAIIIQDGGAAGGSGIEISTVDGHAIAFYAAGAGKHDISLAGSGTIYDDVNNRPVTTTPATTPASYSAR